MTKTVTYFLSLRRSFVLVFALQLLCFVALGQSGINKADKDSIDLWIKQSKIWIEKDETRALETAKKAVRLAKKRKSTYEIAKSEYNLSILYRGLSRSADAMPHYQGAIRNYTKLDSVEKYLAIKGMMGRSHYALGDYPQAMETYMEALEEYESKNIRNEDLAWLLRYIGSVFNREENYVKAMEYYVDAFKVFKEKEDLDGMASCYNTIANVYIAIGDETKALQNYKSGLEMAQKAKNMSRMTIIRDNIGLIYQGRGEYDQALAYFTESYNYLIDSTDHKLDYSVLASNQTSFGFLHLDKKDYKKALEYFDIAEQYAKRAQRKMSVRLLSVYEGRYETFEAMGKYQESLKYHKMMTALKDSLGGTEIANSINQIEANYQSSKGKKRIDALNAEKDALFVEKEKEKANVEKAWRWIMWLILGIIAVTVFSIVIFIQKKKIEWANMSLVGQNIAAVESEQKIKELETQTESNPSPPAETESEPDATNGSKYSKSALLDDQKQDLLERLNHLMEVEKAYTKKDLTVVGVAKKLGTNKSYVSQVINEGKGMNFSSYVNEYRVKEARRLLTDKSYHHLKIESIAGDSGFNSVSAFNNAFKKFTGLTPSYYLKSVKEKG